MDVIVLIGRILFVAIFLASGVAHLTQTRDMEGYVVSKGLQPAPPVLRLGVLMLVGGLMVLLGVVDLGFLILAAFLIPAAVLFHGFWNVSDPEAWPTSNGRIS